MKMNKFVTNCGFFLAFIGFASQGSSSVMSVTAILRCKTESAPRYDILVKKEENLIGAFSMRMLINKDNVRIFEEPVKTLPYKPLGHLITNSSGSNYLYIPNGSYKRGDTFRANYIEKNATGDLKMSAVVTCTLP